MIRPVNDFRVGNLVLDEDGELCKIEQLSSSKMECFQQVSNIENKSCISTKYPSNIYAIKLSEKWLLSMGFKKDKIYYVLKFGSNVDIKINLSTMAYSYLCDIYLSDKLQYVHQIQNLYFSLVGEELVFSSTEP